MSLLRVYSSITDKKRDIYIFIEHITLKEMPGKPECHQRRRDHLKEAKLCG